LFSEKTSPLAQVGGGWPRRGANLPAGSCGVLIKCTLTKNKSFQSKYLYTSNSLKLVTQRLRGFHLLF